MTSVLEERISRSIDLRPRTATLYIECIRDFVAFAGADASAWNPGLVEDWLHRLLTEGRTLNNRGRCSPQTVGVYRKAIRYASRQYAKWRNDERLDFARNVSKLKSRPAAARDPLTFEEADQLLASCDGGSLEDCRDRALLVMAMRTGLRRGGLRALDIEGVRPPRVTTINKGGDPITFEADAETFEALKPWLKALRDNRITHGAVFRRVSAAGVGDRLSAFQIWDIFRRRSEAASIRHVFPHLARHSTVTWLREAGKSSAEVSKLTGQSERTIENIYTHVRTRGAVSAAIPPLRRSRK